MKKMGKSAQFILCCIFGLSIMSIFKEGGLWIIGKVYCAMMCFAQIMTVTSMFKK